MTYKISRPRVLSPAMLAIVSTLVAFFLFLFAPNFALAAPTCAAYNSLTTQVSVPNLQSNQIACQFPASLGGETRIVTENPDGTLSASLDIDPKTGASYSGPSVCTGIVDCIVWLPSALWKGAVTFLAGSLIYISTWLLAAAASLFNWLVDNTIIQFGAFYNLTIKTAVETAWTAFRDIANIFIIGIFTFVAISIILGLKEYGQKKMIASVLVVAVLINFSLLFTKMVIDASNFTAAQIYTAAALGSSTDTQGAAAGSASAAAKYGIADQFMNLLGVGTFAGSYKTVSDGSWPLLHGILVMAVVLGAALVLFYGCFLLVSRMIMLIFLLVTAAIAVASYLIPEWGGSSYGFKAWKSSLIWAATFAPMLMILLWMTLNVSYALKGKSNATLGAALSNPAGGENIAALFNYVLVLGLLFATFKISSMWAHKIGGFSYAQMGAALPFTMGSRFLVAPFLRQTVGLLGAKYQGARVGEMKEARKQASLLRQQEAEAFKNMSPMAARYGADARKFEQLAADKLKAAKTAGIFADGKMNLMDTSAMKTALGQVGAKGFAAGASTKDTKSYEGQQKARAETAEKLAAKAAPSASDNENARNEARRVVREQRQTAEAQFEATRRAAKANEEAVKQFEQLPQKLAAAQRDEQLAKDTASQNKVSIDEALRAGIINQQQHQSQMASENDRIRKATALVKNIQDRIDTVEKPTKDAEKALKDHQKETERLAEGAAKTIVAAMGDAGENIAENVGRQSGDILTRTLGGLTGANEEVGKKTRDIYKKKIQTASLTSVMSQLQADSPPTPPAPPATP